MRKECLHEWNFSYAFWKTLQGIKIIKTLTCRKCGKTELRE